MTSDVLMIAHKLFSVALKRVVVTFECPVISCLRDSLNYYKNDWRMRCSLSSLIKYSIVLKLRRCTKITFSKVAAMSD